MTKNQYRHLFSWMFAVSSITGFTVMLLFIFLTTPQGLLWDLDWGMSVLTGAAKVAAKLVLIPLVIALFYTWVWTWVAKADIVNAGWRDLKIERPTWTR